MNPLKEFKWTHGRNITHLISTFLDMKPSLTTSLTPILLPYNFDWLSIDDFGFTAFNYAIIYVGSLYKENVDFVSKLLDHKAREKLENKRTLTKRQLIFERLLDCSVEIKWYLKSSFLPLVGKLLPSDTIRISKQGSRVLISFSICKVKKVSFSRHQTSILLDFGVQDDSFLNPYAMYIIDHPNKQFAVLNEVFSLEEKKEVLRGMMANKKTKLKQKADLLDNCTVKKTNNKDGTVK